MRTPRILSLVTVVGLSLLYAADLHAGKPSTGGTGTGGTSTGGKPSRSTADSTPPTLAVPGDLSAEAAGPSGTVMNYTVTAVDNLDGSVAPSCTPASGTSFPLGRTTVNCQARDKAGNRAVATFSVAVRDTAAPTIGVPATVSILTPSSSGSTVQYVVTALDRVDPSPNIGCYPESGTLFTVGATTVHCSASDTSGNNTTEEFTVSVAVSPTAPPQPPPPAPTGVAALSWSLPSTRADGSPISAGELAGYEIYVLTESDGGTRVISVTNPLTTTYTINGLAQDMYHFAVAAVDTSGHVSELSPVVSKQVP